MRQRLSRALLYFFQNKSLLRSQQNNEKEQSTPYKTDDEWKRAEEKPCTSYKDGIYSYLMIPLKFFPTQVNVSCTQSSQPQI